MEQKFDILIVDDDVELASNLQDILEAEGYNTAVAHDGQNALTLCREKPFDLALVDIKLPDIPGVKLVEELANLSPEREYVIITGYASLDSAIEAVRQKSIVAYETKPLSMDRLLAILTRWTKGKRALEALQREREKAQRYLDIAGVILIVIDANQKVSLVNKKGCEILGYEEKEIIGKNWFDTFVPEGRRDEVRAVFEKLMAGEIEPVEYFENPILGRSGEERIIAWHNTVLADEAGNIIGTLSSGEDITERRQAEEKLRQYREYLEEMVKQRTAELRKANEQLEQDLTERKRMEDMLKESEERLRLTFESASDGIVVTDLHGNLVRVNETMVHMHGYDVKEELIGRSGFELLAVKDRSRAVENLKRTLEMGHLGKIEYRLLRKDGSEFDAETGAALLPDASGNPVGLVVIVRDISERKKLDQLKDEFIGLVSHELRTPLTVITGAVNTVLTEGSRLSQEETRQLLQDAAWEAESLSHLIGNLLELSRVQADRLFLYAEPISIKNVVQGTVEKVRRQSSLHQFLIELPKELPLVYADQLRLERILYNLLENAVKYSPKGGKIQVSVKPEGEYLVFSISDQGIGISPADQAKLFGPFQRLEHSRPDAVKGAGLGLLVCRRLVEAHGGQIWVESEPGRGSTFFLTLPLSTR